MVRRSALFSSSWSCGDPDHPHCARCRPIVNEILSIKEFVDRSEDHRQLVPNPIEVGCEYKFVDYDESGDTPLETVKVTDFKIAFKKLDGGSRHIYSESIFRLGMKRAKKLHAPTGAEEKS